MNFSCARNYNFEEFLRVFVSCGPLIIIIISLSAVFGILVFVVRILIKISKQVQIQEEKGVTDRQTEKERVRKT